jgi:hypothetical protein
MLSKGVIQCTDDQLKTSHNFDLITLLLNFAMGEVLLVQEVAGVLKSPSTCCEMADEKYCTK